MRRHRERLRHGFRFWRVPLFGDWVEALMDLGLIGVAEAADPARLAAAIGDFCDAALAAELARRGGPGRSGHNAGGVVRGRMDGRMAYAEGGTVIDPVAVPDDEVVDNQPINADEGEFVVTRDAAVALGPEVLAVINDPAIAPMMRNLVMQVLASQGRVDDIEETDTGYSMPARPTTRLGNLCG
jgi:hypothetical protein